MELLPEGPQRNLVIILRGLLGYEVMRLALTKRWRVNFGVDPHGRRRMAVPFKVRYWHDR
jgi:hypothetical protein